MEGDFCCTCFTGGETETHTCSWHHTVGWTVQSGLELKTSKTCCHMLRELERKQLKLRALNTSVSTPSGVQKPGRHLWAPAASLWPMERIWFASTAHIYSPALTSPAPSTVNNPGWALRHSVGPAGCLCARTALCPSGTGSQDELWAWAKSSSPTERAPGITCIWQSLLLGNAALAAQVGMSSPTSKPFIFLPTADHRGDMPIPSP